MDMYMKNLARSDTEAFDIFEAENRRQHDTLNLIASENHASSAVLEAGASVLADKYAEGHPGNRYYRGCENADRAEELAVARAKQVFRAEHANVQPHAGAIANLAVYMAAIKPGEVLMGMDLTHGGHLSHGAPLNYSGIHHKVVSYGVDPKTERLDMDAVAELARKHRPRLIIAGASAYPRRIDFDAFGRVAEEVDALLLSDIAHIAGLVAGGAHPLPFPASDFVTTTTHKTLRGPRGAIILCKAPWAEKIDQAVFPGLQGGPFMHEILAKAVALREASEPEFAQYAAQVVANAEALAEGLMENGWRLATGGTDNHLLLLDLRSRQEDLTGQQASGWLAAARLICNKNKIPFDPRPPALTSGLRFGTPAVTTRGLAVTHMRQVAAWIDRVLNSGGEKGIIERVGREVGAMCEQFPVPNQRD